MKKSTSQEWSFSQQELWLLLKSFAPAILVGINNPYLGWEVDRIRKAGQETLFALREKGLANADSSDRDLRLQSCLETCAHPRHSLLVFSQFAGCAQTRRYIHLGEKAIVEHQNIDPENQRIRVIPGKERMIERLEHGLRMDTTLRAEGDGFFVEEAKLFAANKAYRLGDSTGAEKILNSMDAEKTVVWKMIDALRNPMSNAALISMLNRSESEPPLIRGVSVLEGGQRIWILRPISKDDRRLTEWIPADGDKIRNAFGGILP